MLPASPVPSANFLQINYKSFLTRLLLLATLYAVELIVISVWLDSASVAGRAGLFGFISQWGSWILRGIVGFAVIFLTFVYLGHRHLVSELDQEVSVLPLGRAWMAAHCLAMAAFGLLSWASYAHNLAGVASDLAGLAWLAAGTFGVACGAMVLMPPPLWLKLLQRTGYLWAFTLSGVIAACLLGNYSRALWLPLSRVTFELVRVFLSMFTSSIVANPRTMELGTKKFFVEIAPECSGFEGMGLITAFGVIWLWLFRKECRFPQALLLIPSGVAAIFLLNALRITALILIGNAGAERIALGGFHSQAGWIAFNLVALALCLLARHISWFSNRPAVESVLVSEGGNPTSDYLLPFLTILGVGMVTTAATADFEWLYPLRFLATVGVLWSVRKRFSGLDWKFSWFGISIGVFVFVMWIAIDKLMNAPVVAATPQALQSANGGVRFAWLLIRATSAILTVPIAEELAFRGFLLRRMISEDFESVPLQSFTAAGLAVSSIAFGALHGSLWLAGIITGLLYAWAQLRKGRIGEAVVAHGTTNALLAGYVLLFDQWQLWG